MPTKSPGLMSSTMFRSLSPDEPDVDSLLFSGDVLFAGSVGRSDLPRGNHQQLVESITGRLWPLGDDMHFVPGHGQMSTFGWERKTNPYVCDLALQIADELDKSNATVKRPY